MATVLVPVSLGGSGITYSDSTDAKGMISSDGFGYKANLFPMLSDFVALGNNTAALSASAAAASAGIAAWVSGTTYALGAVVWSPINFQTYRRKVAGAGTTDPSADATNWAAYTAAAVAGGSAGVLLYQSAVNVTSFTAAGTAGQVLASGGTGVPAWQANLALVGGRVLVGGATDDGATPLQVNGNILAVNGGTVGEIRSAGVTYAKVVLNSTGGALNAKKWQIYGGPNNFNIEALNDAENAATGIIVALRSGATPTTLALMPSTGRVLVAGATDDGTNAIQINGPSRFAGILFSTFTSTNTDQLFVENTNTSAALTKLVGISFNGRDTVNASKTLGILRFTPVDINNVASFASIYTRASDTLAEAIRVTSSVTTLNTGLVFTVAAPTVAASQVGFGSTTATTVGAAGAAAALPATPTGYLIINVAGTAQKIPYYN